jgi:2-dehydro-3-deoxyphosphogalactonate aldolase
MIDSKHRLIAIMRGIEPEDVQEMITGLIDSGIRAMEITMNSPRPLESIKIALQIANKMAPGECFVGAGTVLNVDQVDAVHALGGNLIVSPDANPDVIARTVHHGMNSFPGVFTPTEAFVALRHGATGLKFFPASAVGADAIKGIRAVLPPETKVLAVGGVGPDDFAEYKNAGVDGYGLGSHLYKVGRSATDVSERAKEAVAKMVAIYGD